MCPLPSQPGVGQLGNNNNNNKCKCWKGMDSPESHGSAKPAEPPSGSVCGGLSPAPVPEPLHRLLPSDLGMGLYVCMQINQLFPFQLPFLPFLFPKDHKEPEKNVKNLKKFVANVKKVFKILRCLDCSVAGGDLKQPAGWHE